MPRVDNKGMVFACEPVAVGDGLFCYVFRWTANSSGDAVQDGVYVNGEALYADCLNGDGSASGTYSVELRDAANRDGFEGLIAGVAVNSTVRKVLHQVLHSGQQSRGLLLAGRYTFVVDCSASAATAGIVNLYVRGA